MSSVQSLQKSSGGMMMILIIGVLILVLAGGGVGAWLMLGGDKAEAAVESDTPVLAPPQYIPLEPTFIVNLADPEGTRYMQLDVQLMTRDPAMAELVAEHAPLLRNRLMLLFGQYRIGELRTRADKEQLQLDALAEVRSVLEEATGKSAVESLFFTSFVTQ